MVLRPSLSNPNPNLANPRLPRETQVILDHQQPQLCHPTLSSTAHTISSYWFSLFHSAMQHWQAAEDLHTSVRRLWGDLICSSPNTLTNIFWISPCQKRIIVMITITILKSWSLLSTHHATSCAHLSGCMILVSTLALCGGTIPILISHYERG